MILKSLKFDLFKPAETLQGWWEWWKKMQYICGLWNQNIGLNLAQKNLVLEAPELGDTTFFFR